MTDADSAVIEAVKQVEERIEEANRASDVQALESMLADDFSYIGGDGGVQSRQEWLSSLPERRRSPENAAEEQTTSERAQAQGRTTILLLTGLRVGEETEYTIEPHGDVALANRRYQIYNANGSERCLRYIRAYRLQGDQWRMISHRYIHAVD